MLEARTGDKKVPGAITSLKRMRDKIVGYNPKVRVRSPAFMGVLTATSPYAREVKENIYVIRPPICLIVACRRPRPCAQATLGPAWPRAWVPA